MSNWSKLFKMDNLSMVNCFQKE